MVSSDIFADPISTSIPASQIRPRGDHPAARLGIQSYSPLETNKFYANFFLGSQTSPAFLHPYSVWWGRGQGVARSWGICVQHAEATQRVFGQKGPTGAANYYLNPLGIQSVCLGAVELGASTVLTTDKTTSFSTLISLRPKQGAAPAVQFPFTQGAGFVTAVYNGAQPLIQTGQFFKAVSKSTIQPKPGVEKYKLTLEDGRTWLLYALATKGSPPLNMEVANNGLARGKGPFYGIIQVAKEPGGVGEAIYDQACGSYATDITMSGTAKSTKGTYTFTFAKGGLPGSKLVMFALPHHVNSFDGATKQGLTGLKLQTTTKGVATAVLANSWTMVEDPLPISMAFLPWSPQKGTVSTLPASVRAFILKVARQELAQDMSAQSNQNSMYFAGKALAKFATICMCVNDILGDHALATEGVMLLQDAFARFAENRQQYPLVYDSAWGGVVSSATYVTGNSGADFGNTYYNDHHFHYGYFVYAAAVIGHLDPFWIDKNKDFVNTLVRDYANPSAKDPYFPVSRSFDWYAGHSWAHGLFESGDGKDQESSSEDAMSAYAEKMWGMVFGDGNMAARGNLKLKILSRSLQDYYLYRTDNVVQPSNFIGNKVAGIMFENKVDHTTFFGNNIEYVQGIHMLPLMPFTQLCRDSRFAREEWDAYFSDGRADRVEGGWRGILYGNLATFDPKTAYRFFSDPGFDPSHLDGGASLTWYLCYAAAMGGAT